MVTSSRVLVIAAVLLVVAVSCSLAAYRSSGGSSYHSGSYYSRGSSYRSTYRSTYRSSSYLRSGTYSYRTIVRYTRNYYSGIYSTYYNLYYYYSPGSRVYGTTYNNGATGNVCKNWVATENGTVWGLFKCPLDFEPADFKYCCGKKDEEHCCKLKDSPALAWYIVLPIIGVVLLGLGLFYLYKRTQKLAQNNGDGSGTNNGGAGNQPQTMSFGTTDSKVATMGDGGQSHLPPEYSEQPPAYSANGTTNGTAYPPNSQGYDQGYPPPQPNDQGYANPAGVYPPAPAYS